MKFNEILLIIVYVTSKIKRWSSEAYSSGFSTLTSQVFDGLEDLEVRDSQLGMRHFPWSEISMSWIHWALPGVDLIVMLFQVQIIGRCLFGREMGSIGRETIFEFMASVVVSILMMFSHLKFYMFDYSDWWPFWRSWNFLLLCILGPIGGHFRSHYVAVWMNDMFMQMSCGLPGRGWRGMGWS